MPIYPARPSQFLLPERLRRIALLNPCHLILKELTGQYKSGNFFSSGLKLKVTFAPLDCIKSHNLLKEREQLMSSMCLEAFESQLTKSPELIDRFFTNGKFNLDALLAGAKDLGYEFKDEDLTKIDDEIHQKPMTANVAYLVPDEGGEIKELTLNEVELVAAGRIMLPDYSSVNINVNASVAVVAIAIAIIIMLMIPI